VPHPVDCTGDFPAPKRSLGSLDFPAPKRSLGSLDFPAPKRSLGSLHIRARQHDPKSGAHRQLQLLVGANRKLGV
jgi:hypothetical protein